MYKILPLTILCCLLVFLAQSQGVAINSDGSAPDTSAMLDVKSSNKGVLIPRLALTGIHDSATIRFPKTSLLVYNTATAGGLTPGFYYWNVNTWASFGAFNDVLQQNLNTNGKYLSGDGGSNGLFLDSNGIVLGKGVFESGKDFKDTGTGAKLIWYPKKAAFMAGYVEGNEWNDANNIGEYSIALGDGAEARGNSATAIGPSSDAPAESSVAIGEYTTAIGMGSTALGNNALASGVTSVALGEGTHAAGASSVSMGSATYTSGQYSTAMGRFSNALGYSSTAMGYNTYANGDYSTTMGNNCTAGKVNSFAAGDSVNALGANSFALGSYVTTNYLGSFIIGDRSTTNIATSNSTNQMTMRFDNGYRLFTNSATTLGVMLTGGSNAWSTISDVHKKENFEPVDGEVCLQKISTMPLTTWNYKGQDPSRYRHYGPMAQDFYKAFGQDQYGTIGNDTTINQADFDGINFIGIQALEHRTSELKDENARLKKAVELLQADLTTRDRDVQQLKERLDNLTKLVTTLSASNK